MAKIIYTKDKTKLRKGSFIRKVKIFYWIVGALIASLGLNVYLLLK